MSFRPQHVTCCTAAMVAALFFVPAFAQSPRPAFAMSDGLSLAVTYSSATSNDRQLNRVWFKGGAAEASASFWHGLGASASLLGLDASDIGNGIGVHLISFTAGPSYRSKQFWHGSRHGTNLFAHGQLGFAAGFAGLYPGTSSPSSSNNGFAAHLGGGADLRVSRRIALRIVQTDWLHTSLSNGASNQQNTLQLSAGIVVHPGKSL